MCPKGLCTAPGRPNSTRPAEGFGQAEAKKPTPNNLPPFKKIVNDPVDMLASNVHG